MPRIHSLASTAAVSALALGLALSTPAFAEETTDDENTIVVTGSAKIGEYGLDLTARDLTADPGDDFERYASGAWIDRTEIPADRPSVGSFYNLREDVTEFGNLDIEYIDTTRQMADVMTKNLSPKVHWRLVAPMLNVQIPGGAESEGE